MRLDNRVAIVTGGATGIGMVIAAEMAGAGANVAIASRNEGNLRKAAAEIENRGRRVLAIPTDIRSKDQVAALVSETLRVFGQIDILVNNAAVISPRKPLVDLTEEDWDSAFETNLKGPFLCTQAIGRHMMGRRYGKIVNITSMSALGCVTSGLAPYIVSKTGVIGLTKVSAKEFGEYGINVNCIAVGRIITQMSRIVSGPEELDAYIEYGKQASVLERVGTPEDIAHLAVFLASDKSSFITGQIIHDDGGRIDRM